MKNYKLTIAIVLAFVVITSVLMIRATATGTSIVLTPKQLIERAKDLPRVRVAGRVSAQTEIQYIREPRVELRFGVIEPGASDSTETPLNVVYYGLKPDMFAVGRDVILDGEFRNGTLTASTLLTQCPSKYEPPSAASGMNDGAEKQSAEAY